MTWNRDERAAGRGRERARGGVRSARVRAQFRNSLHLSRRSWLALPFLAWAAVTASAIALATLQTSGHAVGRLASTAPPTPPTGPDADRAGRRRLPGPGAMAAALLSLAAFAALIAGTVRVMTLPITSPSGVGRTSPAIAESAVLVSVADQASAKRGEGTRPAGPGAVVLLATTVVEGDVLESERPSRNRRGLLQLAEALLDDSEPTKLRIAGFYPPAGGEQLRSARAPAGAASAVMAPLQGAHVPVTALLAQAQPGETTPTGTTETAPAAAAEMPSLWPLPEGAGSPAPARPTVVGSASILPPGDAYTTDRLNLREGAGKGFAVLTVIPRKTRVTITGAPIDGFYPVTYEAYAGWAYGEYLRAIRQTGAALWFHPVYTTDRLNLRRGADLESEVIAVMPQYARIELLGLAVNGFYPVRYGDAAGWASGDYLSPGEPPVAPPSIDPGPAYTRERLNLRAGAGSEFEVLTMMPPYAPVEVTGARVDGFYPVQYGDLTGWAHSRYLAAGTPPRSPRLTVSGVNGFQWPIIGPITSYFGPKHPLGIDIGTKRAIGLPVAAALDGEVTFAGGDPCCSYGLYVVIEHDGGFTTLYGHLSQVDVAVGQFVVGGEEIGLSGSTGYSTGPHLHFEIRLDGVRLDPLDYLPDSDLLPD